VTDLQDHGPSRIRRYGRTKDEIEIEDAATITWLVGVATAIVAGGYLFLATASGVDQATLDAAVGARSETVASSDGSTTEGMTPAPVSAVLPTPPLD
jgi:hypothetical protein